MNSTITSARSFIIFAIGALVFVGLKWSDLTLPPFWDELGVYVPGILHMVDNGTGLLPADLPPEMSRGHPLLFYAVFAGFHSIVGFSLFKLHLLALFFTLLLGGSIWWIGSKWWNPSVGMMAGLCFLAFPPIYAIGSMALPEVMLALWAIWALYHFSHAHYKAYILFASLALLTKESGLVMPIAAFCWALLNSEKGAKDSLSALSPLLTYGLFLLIQYQTHGWFFFPYHVELISFDLTQIFRKLEMSMYFLFVDQARWTWGILLAVGSILYTRKGFKRIFNAPAFLLVICLLGMLGFTILNAYMDRYLLLLLPMICLLGMAAMIEEILPLFTNALKIPVLLIAGLMVIGLPFISLNAQLYRGTHSLDMEHSYRSILKVQQEASAYMQTQLQPSAPFFANFPLYNCFLDSRFGFVAETEFFNPTVKFVDSLEFAAVMTPSGTEIYPPDSLMIKHFQDGFAQVKVYRFPEVEKSIVPPSDSLSSQ